MTLSTYPISNGLPAFNLGPSFLEYAIQREMKMASIKENLIAARALIDTPEKFADYGMSRSRALYEATANWDDYFAADMALSQHRVRGYGHESVMNMFDRAISAQDGA